MLEPLNAVGQAVRATAAKCSGVWECRTDLQAAPLSSRLAELPGMMASVKSVDAQGLKNALIHNKRGKRVAHAVSNTCPDP